MDEETLTFKVIEIKGAEKEFLALKITLINFYMNIQFHSLCDVVLSLIS